MGKNKKELTPMRDHKVYLENPFEKMLAVHIAEKGKSKINKVITQTGQLVDKETGDVVEGESLFVATRKVVDDDQFTKVFHDSIKETVNVSDKAINVLMVYIAPMLGKDELQILFDIDECEVKTEYSRATIYRALAELLDAEIIARTKYQWLFFINPLYIFNGDRIRVVNDYVRKAGNLQLGDGR